jgi:hypothetical protein
MKTSYSELVIKAPFLLVKGLLLGFMHGRDETFNYFFDRKAGVRRETLGEMFRELMELDTHTYLCLPNHVIADFMKMIENIEERIGIEVESVKEIGSAEFSFSFEIFNRKYARSSKEFIENLPGTIQLLNYEPKELVDEGLVDMTGGYAPVHSYCYSGQGIARGEFADIMEAYLKIKRSKLADSVLCSEIRLYFKENASA